VTFQAWQMVLLNSMTFQEEWSPWTHNCKGPIKLQLWRLMEVMDYAIPDAQQQHHTNKCTTISHRQRQKETDTHTQTYRQI